MLRMLTGTTSHQCSPLISAVERVPVYTIVKIVSSARTRSRNFIPGSSRLYHLGFSQAQKTMSYALHSGYPFFFLLADFLLWLLFNKFRLWPHSAISGYELVSIAGQTLN